MQIVTCKVAVGGDLNNVRAFDPIDEVTVPEVVILRELHGVDSVTDVKVCGTVKRSIGDEVARLKAKYDWNRQGENQVQIVPRLFPGVRPNLPTTLSEVEVEAEELKPVEAEKPVEVESEEPVPPRRAPRAARTDALD